MVLYAGKARNVQRRLRTYRNASRRKVDRKMRTLVREASEIEIRLQASERDALLVENELIRTLRPRHNVDGAYTSLYPAIGTALRDHQVLVCFTTQTEAWADLGFRWHGCFRSRLRAREAFEALLALLDWAGHREPRSRLPPFPRIRGSRIAAYRRVAPLFAGLERFLAGTDSGVLQVLSEGLLANPDACRDAAQIGEDLRCLDAFFREDAEPLRRALEASGRKATFVPQDERDALMIAERWRGGGRP